jgi:O-antigen/teichoic acid export membrane protein
VISINKQNYQSSFTHRIILLFSARLIPALVLILISILYSRKLNYDDYGIYQSTLMYINIAAVISCFGIPSVILSREMFQVEAFFEKYKSKIILFLTLLFVIVCAAAFQTGHIQLRTKLLGSALILTQTVISIFETILIKQIRDKPLFYINFLYSLLFFLWHYYLLLDSFTINALLVGLLLIQLIKVLILYGFTKKIQPQKNIIDAKAFISHWSYLGLNDVLGVLSKWIDKLIILFFITPDEFALFFNGTYEIPLISLLVSVAGNIFVMNIAENINYKFRVFYIFSQGFIFLSKIVFPIFFFFLFFHTECFRFFFW